MPTITVTNDPVHGYNIIQLNWSDQPTVTHARVVRVAADGTETVVRVHTAESGIGYIELSAGLATVYDTEAPLDVSISYRTEDAALTATATSAVLILASGNDFWLKSPLHPWADRRITQNTPDTPGCVPESAVYFAGMDVESRPNRTGTFVVNNRRLPIAASRVRGGISSTLMLVSRSFVDRDALIEINAPGDPLLLQGPPAYGIPDRYMTVGEYQISRLSSDLKVQGRMHQMPHVEVDRPAGLADGVLGVRWVDLCDEYATFGDVNTAGLSWGDVLLGLASNEPLTLFRLYGDIPVDFATYGDIPTGGRTYEDLLEGR